MIVIQLPYPPKELSPNARVHWSKKARAMHESKELATVETTNEAMELPVRARKELVGNKHDLRLCIIFHPARKGRYDRDNALARCKGYLDGIAAALDIDDSQFEPTTLRRGDVIKGGLVVFEIYPS